MKTIRTMKVLGYKIPILTIVMALLVIGMASAAVFMNYATLRGDFEVEGNGVTVTEDGGLLPLAIGGTGGLDFSSPATFTINNDGDAPVIVTLVTGLELEGDTVTDFEGLEVVYSVFGDGGIEGIEGGLVLVPPGGLTVDVELIAADNAIPGTYTVQVAVDFDDTAYEGFAGANEMEDLELTHKEDFGTGGLWTPIDDISTLSFAQMGNDFYYELDATGLEASTDYTIIYYADQVDRFVNWGGAAPGVIDTFTTDVDGNYVETGRLGLDLNMDMPSASDENYPGAKIWIIPTSALGLGDTALPMDEWEPERYLFELDALTQYEDTNIVAP